MKSQKRTNGVGRRAADSLGLVGIALAVLMHSATAQETAGKPARPPQNGADILQMLKVIAERHPLADPQLAAKMMNFDYEGTYPEVVTDGGGNAGDRYGVKNDWYVRKIVKPGGLDLPPPFVTIYPYVEYHERSAYQTENRNRYVIELAFVGLPYFACITREDVRGVFGPEDASINPAAGHLRYLRIGPPRMSAEFDFEDGTHCAVVASVDQDE